MQAQKIEEGGEHRGTALAWACCILGYCRCQCAKHVGLRRGGRLFGQAPGPCPPCLGGNHMQHLFGPLCWGSAFVSSLCLTRCLGCRVACLHPCRLLMFSCTFLGSAREFAPCKCMIFRLLGLGPAKSHPTLAINYYCTATSAATLEEPEPHYNRKKGAPGPLTSSPSGSAAQSTSISKASSPLCCWSWIHCDVLCRGTCSDRGRLVPPGDWEWGCLEEGRRLGVKRTGKQHEPSYWGCKHKR